MRKLQITLAASLLVILCLIPWIAMPPNLWRIPSGIILAPFFIPLGLLIWFFGDGPQVKRTLEALLPETLVRAWNASAK